MMFGMSAVPTAGQGEVDVKYVVVGDRFHSAPRSARISAGSDRSRRRMIEGRRV